MPHMGRWQGVGVSPDEGARSVPLRGIEPAMLSRPFWATIANAGCCFAAPVRVYQDHPGLSARRPRIEGGGVGQGQAVQRKKRVDAIGLETGCSPSSMHCSLARGLASANVLMRCAKGSAGTGNPACEATRILRFPGCRRACPNLRVKGGGACHRHVTSSGGSRASRAGVRDCSASVSSFRVTAPMRTGGNNGPFCSCSITAPTEFCAPNGVDLIPKR